MKIAAAVAEETKLPFVTAENKFEALVISFLAPEVHSYICFLILRRVGFLLLHVYHPW